MIKHASDAEIKVARDYYFLCRCINFLYGERCIWNNNPDDLHPILDQQFPHLDDLWKRELSALALRDQRMRILGDEPYARLFPNGHDNLT